jgi:hypothetical protein
LCANSFLSGKSLIVKWDQEVGGMTPHDLKLYLVATSSGGLCMVVGGLGTEGAICFNYWAGWAFIFLRPISPCGQFFVAVAHKQFQQYLLFVTDMHVARKHLYLQNQLEGKFVTDMHTNTFISGRTSTINNLASTQVVYQKPTTSNCFVHWCHHAGPERRAQTSNLLLMVCFVNNQNFFTYPVFCIQNH